MPDTVELGIIVRLLINVLGKIVVLQIPWQQAEKVTETKI